MHCISIAETAGLETWRTAARHALSSGIPPHEVVWQNATQPGLFQATVETGPPSSADFIPQHTVSQAFLDLAALALRHRCFERFSLLYRTLWRITHEDPGLLHHPTDPDMFALHQAVNAVRHDA